MSLGEFALIRQFFSQGYPKSPDTVLGVGDDCSIVRPRQGFDLVQSIDTQIADIHFPATAPADLIAERALRCAASDLAAMGAVPQGFHLALSLPEANPVWLERFSQGLKACANDLGLELLGGDTTRSAQLVISVAVQGFVPQGSALTRSGAQIGDDIWVSDTIGQGALALAEVLKNPADFSGVSKHYYFPQVQLELGQKLLGVAHACMDISDGLLQDAAHIAHASQVQMLFYAEQIPTPAEYLTEKWWQAVSGGDDYQLLFTAPKSARHELLNLRLEHSGLCRVGEVVAQACESVRLLNEGKELTLPKLKGFNHF